jgi:hypothetical protein
VGLYVYKPTQRLCRGCAQKWAATANPPYFPKETNEFFASFPKPSRSYWQEDSQGGKVRITRGVETYDELVEMLVVEMLDEREAQVRSLIRTLPQPIWEEIDSELKGPFS